MLVVPMSSASLGTFKQNSCVNIVTILNGTSSVNLSVYYPNNSLANSSMMNKNGNRYTSNFCNTSDMGIYNYDYFDDLGNVYVNDFSITYNGRPEPEGIVVVFFSICFLLVIGLLSYLMIYNIGHLGQMDYDLGDLIKNVSAYFVLLALYLLSIFYMGNQMIDNIMVWIISITGFTNVGMSFLFFIIVFLAKRKEKTDNAW